MSKFSGLVSFDYPLVLAISVHDLDSTWHSPPPRQQYMVGPERLYLASRLNLTEAQVENFTSLLEILNILEILEIITSVL